MAPLLPPVDVAGLVDRLGLEPHPEGGWYRRTFEHPGRDQRGRPLASAILYLLGPGDVSHWHRLDAVELWTHVGGDLLELSTSLDGVGEQVHVIGSALGGHEPQHEVPAGAWQSARPVDGLVLVTCQVVPAFTFEGFELAPPCWSPGSGT